MPTTQRCGVIAGVFALVAALSAQAKVDPAAVVGMWLFDEGGGKTAVDSSENGLDGAVVGPADWEKGMFGQAMQFDGASVAVEVTEDPSLVLPELTIVAWANIVSSAGVRWQSIMMRGQDPRNYLLVVDKDSQKLQLSITKGAPGAWGGPIAGEAISDETWHHLAAVIGPDTGLATFFDGVLLKADAYTEPSQDATPAKTVIGDGSAGGHQLEGLLDEVALFNVELTEDQIVEIMNDGLEAATGLSKAVDPSGKAATTWGRLRADR